MEQILVGERAKALGLGDLRWKGEVFDDVQREVRPNLEEGD